MATVTEVLTNERENILDAAAIALERSNLPHYAQAGPTAARERLARLLALVLQSVDTRDLVPMIEHATHIAHERFDAGFDIHEVQSAFNVLEEAIWVRVVAATPPAELAESLGLVGTVLGTGRDTLACTYVSLATRQHVPSLDLSALFRGGR
ncbi:MAG: hypothetical protein GYA65_00215 [Actinobacteria bacterium]|nr:hypothetical protein [Acidimicrobiaceae bacterium]MBP6487458.1 hypothetical protein [Ilumatobacteraceae bacterium]NMD22581.1 hypothetical protein [Actinomycetota bacterium]MBK9971717.1 hypothetical protein [Acidimicrobiaceae bacterium]MBP7888295.1 hypothetical protein [Ilumatobacteraceae bacterium]